MAWLSAQTRSTLAVLWALFLFVWLLSAGTVMGLSHLACGLENTAPTSRYCDAAHDYFKSGEPGEVTTALVYLWPVAFLVGVGAYGIWKRRAGLLVVVATIAVGVVLAHAVFSFTLP
jgi:hypothetical protein